MKNDGLFLLILAGLGLMLYSKHSGTKTVPVAKPATGTQPVTSSTSKPATTSSSNAGKPAVVQTNPNSRNPNVTIPDLNSVIDGVGRAVNVFTPDQGTTGNVLQPTANTDNPSFDAGDKLQEAYGSTDMGDYADHLGDDGEAAVSAPSDVPSDTPASGEDVPESNEFAD